MKILKIAGLVVLVLLLGAIAAGAYLASTADARLSAPQTPMPDVAASTDPAVIARGRYLVRTVAHCSQCHADYPRMEPAKNTHDSTLSGGFEFAMGPMGSFYAANLTPDGETGIGQRTDPELARAITTGVLHDGSISIFMRYSAANLSNEDVVAVISYLRSLPPVRHVVPPGAPTTIGKIAISFMNITPDLSPLPEHVEKGAEPSLERGRYLAENVALCVACHSEIDMATFQPTGPKAAGGNPDPSHGDDPDMEFVTPNLTSDPKTGITGKLTEDQFLARLKHGRIHVPSVMPWENFTRMDDSDMRSVYRYLRSLPPVERDVGPTYRKQGSFTKD